METELGGASKTVEVKHADAVPLGPENPMVDDPNTNDADKNAEALTSRIKRSVLSPFACFLLACGMRNKSGPSNFLCWR